MPLIQNHLRIIKKPHLPHILYKYSHLYTYTHTHTHWHILWCVCLCTPTYTPTHPTPTHLPLHTSPYTHTQEFIAQATPALVSTSNGVFIDSCLVHCQTLTDDTWSVYKVSGQLMSETFANWYFGRSGKTQVVDCAYPCNPTCPGVHPLDRQLPLGLALRELFWELMTLCLNVWGQRVKDLL